jgi:hypothetical protein
MDWVRFVKAMHRQALTGIVLFAVMELPVF